jgi:hypothetical protein
VTDNPYAPPTAALLHDKPRAPRALPARRTRIDLGEALASPFQGVGWLKNLVVIGLVVYIPIIGFCLLFGWQARIYDRVRDGRGGIPRLVWGEDLPRGAKIFGSFLLNATVPTLPIAGLLLLGIAVLNFGGDDMLPVALAILLPSYALLIIVSLMLNAVFPELERRAFRGEWLILLRPMPSVRAIRAAPTSYLLALVGLFLGNLIGGLGVLVCYFGVFFSIPIGYAITSHVIAQWSMIIDDIEIQDRARA